MASGAANENNIISGAANENISITFVTNEMTDCPICLEPFDAKTKIVRCHCNHKTCLPCTKEYLKNTLLDPHCVYCKRSWDKEFQYNNFTKTFINGEYNKYRKKLLLDREKSKLPESLNMLANILEIEKYTDQIKLIKNELSEINKKRNELRNYLLSLHNKIISLKKKEPINKKLFIKPCPMDNCRGYLSTQYKCAMCNVHVCSKCMEPIGLNKNDQHTCDPNNVKTIEELKKTTKPCPKCGTRIYKIIGCDQMWCTQCHVPFSWSKGNIQNGTIHNPHYLEWIKKTNGTIPRNPLDLQCGGNIGYVTLSRTSRKFAHLLINNTLKERNDKIVRKLELTYRLFIDFQETSFRQVINKIPTLSTVHDLTIRYLRNEIDENKWSSLLSTRDKQRSKYESVRDIYVMYRDVVIDIFQNWTIEMNNLYEKYNKNRLTKQFYKDNIHINNNEKTIQMINAYKEVENVKINVLNRINQIRKYANKELYKIAKNYNMLVKYIDIFTLVTKSSFSASKLDEKIKEESPIIRLVGPTMIVDKIILDEVIIDNSKNM